MQVTGTTSTIFDNGAQSLIVSFQSDGLYGGMSVYITKSRTPTTTGLCGSTGVVSNLVCYLKGADGVYTVAADAGDTPLPGLVSFSNDLATALGTQ